MVELVGSFVCSVGQWLGWGYLCGMRRSQESARALCYTYDTMAQALTLVRRPEVIVLDESL